MGTTIEDLERIEQRLQADLDAVRRTLALHRKLNGREPSEKAIEPTRPARQRRGKRTSGVIDVIRASASASEWRAASDIWERVKGTYPAVLRAAVVTALERDVVRGTAERKRDKAGVQYRKK